MAAEVPGWLGPFLEGKYFAHCRFHVSSKNERNHFCVDCSEGPLCHTGWQEHVDRGHRTLQVRRASHMDAVRINDIQKLLDTSSIQPYTINGAKIIFLLSRPQSKLTKGSLRCCEMCGRSISDPVRFCSITCKLACVVASYDDTQIVLRKGGGNVCSRDSSPDDQAGPSCSHHHHNLDDDQEQLTLESPSRSETELKRVMVSEDLIEQESTEIRGFKRARLQILVDRDHPEEFEELNLNSPMHQTRNHEDQHQQHHQQLGRFNNEAHPPSSPNSVLLQMVTPTTCRSHGLSPSTPRSSHRKGTPHRSPLF